MYPWALLVSFLFVACGSPSKAVPDAGPSGDAAPDAAPDASTDAPATHTVGGSVTGLVGSGLVLQNNGGDDLAIGSDGAFVFATPVADGAPYAVTVAVQPRGEVCDVANGDGVIAGADVESVSVSCHGEAVRIAAGDTAICTIRADGTLWCWGRGPFPTAGGCAADPLSPVQIGSDTTWTSVVGAQSQFMMLRTDHTLWAFDSTCTPARVGTANDWVELSAGRNEACMVRADRTLWCAQVGTFPTQSFDPVQQGTDTTWAHVAADDDHTCAIKTDGTLWCEGNNMFGELGVGDTQAHSGFVQVGTDTWTQVSVGGPTTCAVRSGGTLWCWGTDPFDVVGNGDTSSPVLRTAGTWERVTVGRVSACAVRTDGALWCWGLSVRGMLGVGTSAIASEPREVVGDESWSDAAIPSLSYSACGLARDGTVWCWGDNDHGVLGDGLPAPQAPTPTRLDGSWLHVSQGAESSCAIRDDHSLWCWGSNLSEMLGTGESNDSDRAVPWPAASTASWDLISVGGTHVCGLQTDKSLWCWGQNGNGELGLSGSDARVPTQVGTERSWTAVSTGGAFTCAIKQPGTLWCWGDDRAGQAADASLGANITPHQVGTDSDWASIAAGSSHACALKSNGTAWCWGYAMYGALGSTPSCTRCATPMQVGTATWTSLAAGSLYTTAIRDDGTLWRWGTVLNVGDWPMPEQVGTETTWSRTTANSNVACATRTDGTLWCWGDNSQAEVGIGSSTPTYLLPVATGGSASWLPLDSDTHGRCAIEADHSLWCWGDDHYGECGLDDAWHDVLEIVP